MTLPSLEDMAVMLQELHNEVGYGDRQPGDFTASEYAKANGLTDNAAYNEIGNLIRLKKIAAVGKVLVNSRRQNIYRKVR